MANALDIYFFERALAQIAGKNESEVPKPYSVEPVIKDIVKVAKQKATCELFKKNNPDNKPVGDHTGRCKFCGSNDLWEDNLSYGCNCCQEGAILSFGGELFAILDSARQNVRYE